MKNFKVCHQNKIVILPRSDAMSSKFLNIQSTNTSSERKFNDVGTCMPKTRNRLSMNHLMKQCCMKSLATGGWDI